MGHRGQTHVPKETKNTTYSRYRLISQQTDKTCSGCVAQLHASARFCFADASNTDRLVTNMNPRPLHISCGWLYQLDSQAGYFHYIEVRALVTFYVASWLSIYHCCCVFFYKFKEERHQSKTYCHLHDYVLFGCHSESIELSSLCILVCHPFEQGISACGVCSMHSIVTIYGAVVICDHTT